MKRFGQFLLSPLFLGALGVIALSALVWWIGPLIAIGDRRPLDATWVRLTIIAVMVLIWVIRLVLGIVNRKRTNAALAEGIAKGPTSAEKEVGTLNDKFTQALDVLKQSPGAKKGGNLLYDLPWYMFVGAPGSGKTTALLNAGLTFPLAEKLGQNAVRGVGGTRNCDWWFTDEAVMIDTAGRYTMQESDSAVDAAAWDGFLALLRKSRPRRPLNGVLLTVSIQDLLQQTPTERKDHAAKLRARMQELTEKLGVRPPVYVLVTKSDLIAGFNETFGEFNKEDRNQVWGFSFPYSPASEDPMPQFGSEFAALEKRLRDRVLERMEAEHDVLKRASIFNFPQQFAGLRGLLGGFLESVFSAGGSLEERPLLRGVYFTSGTQEGTPIDRVMGTLARTFGVERRLAPPAAARGKSFFLSRLLKDVVFQEQALVGSNQKMEQRTARWRLVGYAFTVLACIGLLGGWALSFTRNKAYVAEIAKRMPDIKQIVETVPPATNADVSPLVGVLSAVRLAPIPEGFDITNPPWTHGFGLYQGDKLEAGAITGYNRLLDKALMPRVVRRLEERLRAANRDNLEDAYEGLRSYLMLYTPDKWDPDGFKSWVAQDWEKTLERALTPEQRQTLNVHLDALVSRGAPPPVAPMDKNLVAGVREMLGAFPLEFRVFSRLKRAQVGADLPPFTVAGAAGPQALQVLVRASGEPLTKGIPGLFTKAGFRQALQPQVEKATRQLAAEEAWVLGSKTTTTSVGASLTGNAELVGRVRRLYFEEYIKTWDKYIADVKVVKTNSIDESLKVARTLSAVDSPLAAFLRGVARETTLVEPVKAPGADSGTKAGQADQKLLDAKREITAVLGRVPGTTQPVGPPMEQMVDDHFTPIRRLFIGQPQPIDDMLKMFNEVYVQLAAVDEAQKNKTAPPPAGGADRIKAAAGQQPEPIRSILESVSGAAATAGRTAEIGSIAGDMKPINEFCARAISGRYPFTSASKADVLPEDFAQFFGQGGQLDEFWNTKLAKLVDISTTPWSFRPVGDAKPVSPAALADFQRAARIREVFFRGGGKVPTFKVDMRAAEIGEGLKEIVLDIDGQITKFVPGNGTPVTIAWPSARVASQIKLQGLPNGAVMQFDGPWALFRMFDRFEVTPSAQPEKFTVSFNLEGRRARFEVTSNSVFNPFRLKEMQQFRCPGGL
ncbi:MAG: type VI secretion system membrane subunit TssM [Aquabacterium sp.]